VVSLRFSLITQEIGDILILYIRPNQPEIPFSALRQGLQVVVGFTGFSLGDKPPIDFPRVFPG